MLNASGSRYIQADGSLRHENGIVCFQLGKTQNTSNVHPFTFQSSERPYVNVAVDGVFGEPAGHAIFSKINDPRRIDRFVYLHERCWKHRWKSIR